MGTQLNLDERFKEIVDKLEPQLTDLKNDAKREVLTRVAAWCSQELAKLPATP